MMHFVKVKMKHQRIENPLDYGWMLKLSTPDEVLTYFEKFDRMAVNVYKDMDAMISGKGHYTDRASWLVEILARKDECSPVDALSKLLGRRLSNVLFSLPFYINRKGGGFPQNKDCTEYAQKESDRWPSEIANPEFMKWPGGRHWYCKVGGIDIVVEDKQKWNTKAGAELAYKKWKRTNAS